MRVKISSYHGLAKRGYNGSGSRIKCIVTSGGTTTTMLYVAGMEIEQVSGGDTGSGYRFPRTSKYWYQSVLVRPRSLRLPQVFRLRADQVL